MVDEKPMMGKKSLICTKSKNKKHVFKRAGIGYKICEECGKTIYFKFEAD